MPDKPNDDVIGSKIIKIVKGDYIVKIYLNNGLVYEVTSYASCPECETEVDSHIETAMGRHTLVDINEDFSDYLTNKHRKGGEV